MNFMQFYDLEKNSQTFEPQFFYFVQSEKPLIMGVFLFRAMDNITSNLDNSYLFTTVSWIVLSA